MNDTGPTRITMSQVGAVLGRLTELTATLPEAERAAIEAWLRAARVAETCPIQYNPYLPGVHADPYPHYARLRAESPVHFSEAIHAWVITRHEDVVAALNDGRLSSRGAAQVVMGLQEAQRREVQRYDAFVSGMLNQLDPPEHTPLRAVMVRGMNPEVIARARPLMRAVVDALLDRAIREGTFDLIGALAQPLPLHISAALLGLPPADWATVNGWMEAITGTFSDTADPVAAMRRGDDAMEAFEEYLRPLVRERRGRPGDDVISLFAAGGDVDEDAIVRLCVEVPIGAHENLRHMIGLGVLSLLSTDGAWERLRADRTLIPSAVQEMFRHATVSWMVGRTAAEELSVGGMVIPAGDQVLLMLAAANHDGACFTHPDQVDVERRPNPHIAFGAGIHACPGAAFARVATELVLTGLLDRCAGLRLGGAPVWREQRNIRGLVSLPVIATPENAR